MSGEQKGEYAFSYQGLTEPLFLGKCIVWLLKVILNIHNNVPLRKDILAPTELEIAST